MKRDHDESEIVDYDDNEDSDVDEHSRKAPRLNSVVANISDNNTHVTMPSRVERLQSDDHSLARNKRMFSGLLNHLGQARKRLETENDRLEKQNSLQQNVFSRHMEEGRKLAEIEKQLNEKEKTLIVIARERNDINRKLSSLDISLSSFVDKQNKFKYFLKTKTVEPIYWLPKRHTSCTESQLQSRQNEAISSIDEQKLVHSDKLNLLQTRLEEIVETEKNLRADIEKLQSQYNLKIIGDNSVSISNNENATDNPISL